MSTELQSRPLTQVFIATTVMLTCISFWGAAAIVLSDLASSAYYAGGEAEHYIGKSAPCTGREYAAFLREVAEFFDAHPYLPIPEGAHSWCSITNTRVRQKSAG